MPGQETHVSDDAMREFLAELIDDAGLFPPARLPMAEALRARADATAGETFWIAGRFVVAASRLAELGAALDEAPGVLGLAVVVDAPVADAGAFASLAREAEALAGRVAVEAVEVPLARVPGATLDERVAALGAAARELVPAAVVYLEIPFGDAGDEALAALASGARTRVRRMCEV